MIPDIIRPFLWSFDISKISLENNKKRIITNVLNFGTFESAKWIFENYTLEDIKETLENPLPGEWDKKSYNFWCLITDSKPHLRKRFK